MVMFTVVMSLFISVFVRMIVLLVVGMIMVVRVTLCAMRALLAVDVARLGIMIVAITIVVIIWVETWCVHCNLRILFLLNILLYSTNLRFNY